MVPTKPNASASQVWSKTMETAFCCTTVSAFGCGQRAVGRLCLEFEFGAGFHVAGQLGDRCMGRPSRFRSSRRPGVRTTSVFVARICFNAVRTGQVCGTTRWIARTGIARPSRSVAPRLCYGTRTLVVQTATYREIVRCAASEISTNCAGQEPSCRGIVPRRRANPQNIPVSRRCATVAQPTMTHHARNSLPGLVGFARYG